MLKEEPIIDVKNKPGESLMLRVMEDDNSCLFRAVNYVFMRDVDLMTQLRLLIVQAIQDDSKLPDEDQKFSAAVLGMSRDKYCQRISDPNTWGGAIELQILAVYFDMEIWSIDVATGLVYKFNEGRPSCGIVIYSGIHYDCVAMTPTPDIGANDVTVFDTEDAGVLEAALTLAEVLKSRNYYTDTTNFSIRCNECGKGLKGERMASEHAMETGHVDFGEYR